MHSHGRRRSPQDSSGPNPNPNPNGRRRSLQDYRQGAQVEPMPDPLWSTADVAVFTTDANPYATSVLEAIGEQTGELEPDRARSSQIEPASPLSVPAPCAHGLTADGPTHPLAHVNRRDPSRSALQRASARRHPSRILRCAERPAARGKRGCQAPPASRSHADPARRPPHPPNSRDDDDQAHRPPGRRRPGPARIATAPCDGGGSGCDVGLLRPATVAPGSALALPTTHPAAGTTRASIVSTLPTATTPSEGATHPTPTLAAAALASSSLASTSGRLHAERRTQLSVVRLCRRWHVHHGRMHGPQVGRVQLQGVLRTATPRFTALPRIGPRLVPFLDHPSSSHHTPSPPPLRIGKKLDWTILTHENGRARIRFAGRKW